MDYYDWGDNMDIVERIKECLPETDNVNHPDHYAAGGIETIAIIKAKMTHERYLGFLQGNVIKYVTRAGFKNNELEDLEKAEWYLNTLIDEEDDADAD